MTSILADRQYTLLQFRAREEAGNINELDTETIAKINKLAKRVGAPSYQKTPVFKRNNHYYSNKKTKKDNISNDDWEAIRNFKNTILHKNKDGLDAKMDKIRSYLNKLTEDNYNEISECIVLLIKDIIKEENNDALEKVGKSIFEIGSFNKFWSKLYARLYKDLIKSFEIMKEICLKNFNSFEDLFTNINYIDPKDDYNLFCEYNKENEKRRALSSFFIICASYNIIEKNDMEKIIVNFINKIHELMDLKNKQNTIEEIVTNISVMLHVIMRHDVKFLMQLDQYEFIRKNILNFAKSINYKQHPSLTQKIVFKFMDLNDELEDYE